MTQATQKSVLSLDTKWKPIRIYPVYHNRDNPKPSECSDDEAVAYADDPADAKRTAIYQGEVKAVF